MNILYLLISIWMKRPKNHDQAEKLIYDFYILRYSVQKSKDHPKTGSKKFYLLDRIGQMDHFSNKFLIQMDGKKVVMEDILKLQTLVDKSNRIVFFGGAGVSTESGIPDFRSVDGLYNQKYGYPPEMILSHSFFLSKTKEFYDFYRDKMIVKGVQPNKAHYKLAELEAKGKLTAVITQNIDGLHQLAGSKKVLELHGSIQRNSCMCCRKAYDLAYIEAAKDVPHCECGGIIKPDVVLYEEGLDMGVIHDAVDYIQKADLLIIGGTSLGVYPAAGLVDYFRGDDIVLINRDATAKDHIASLVIRDKIGEVLGAIRV